MLHVSSTLRISRSFQRAFLTLGMLLGISACAGGKGELSITINPEPTATSSPTPTTVAPAITYSGSPFTFTNGTAITSQTPVNTGDAITSCSSSPTLPTGLALSSTCVLSGTPTAISATASYTISATNSIGTGTTSISITVNDPAPAIAYSGSPFTFTKDAAITSQTPTNTGGAITSCSSSPSLPAGLALSSTCVLSGTPTAVTATTSYTISATNSGGTGTASISITVNDIAPAIAYSGSPFTFVNGVAITSQTPTNSGGTTTSCSSSPTLPAGLALSSTCILSGTPTAVTATANYTISATNSGGTGTASISITVNDPAPVISYAGTPYSFVLGSAVGPIGATNTGGVITGCSITPSLPTGLAIDTSCVITGTPAVLSSAVIYTVTATNSGGSGNTTLSIAVVDVTPVIGYSGAPFTFTKDAAITSQTPSNTGGTITSCSSSPTLPAGLALSSTCVLSGTPTAVTATASYTISATNSGGTGTASISITVNDIPPAIAYTGSPYTFINGVAITSQTPTNTGGTTTSCSSSPTLPAGLALSSTCVLSGTPTAVTTTASYTISATNSGGTGTASISITVNDAIPAIAYAGSPFVFTKGTAITTVTPSNTGGIPSSCVSSPSLPAGLTLSATCEITGTPTTKSTAATFAITATNTTGSQSPLNISITVNNPPYSLSLSTVVASPTTVVSGSTSTVTLQLKDAGGANLDTTGLTVAFTTSGGTSTGTFGSVTDNGDGTYSALFTGVLAGTAKTVGATIAGSAVTSTMPTITVTPGTVASLAFTGQPDSTRTAGQAFTSVDVTLYDAAGNVATTSTDNVTLAMDETNCTAGAVPGGTLTATPSSGIANFTTAYSTIIGTGYCLMATANGIQTTVSSSTYDVTVGTVTKLVYIEQPTSANITAPISPSITIGLADAYGNVDTSAATKNITLAIGTNPGSSTLSGTLTQATSSGISTFSDISLNNAGTGYTLTATCSTGGCTFTAATSATFDITNTAPINLESAVELVDAGISSSTSSVKFNSTQVNLDPSFYDGTVTYTFEVVAKNTHSSTAYNVTLNSKTAVTSGSCSSSTTYTALTTISIPANTNSFKRFTASITAPTSSKAYAISLPATTSSNQIQVSAARIIVKQVGARKTRIYVPLTSGPEGTYSNTTTTPVVDTSTSSTYSQPNPNRYYTWRKDVANLVSIASSNGLALEAVLSNSANSTATSVGLTNVTTSTQVASTVISSTASGSSGDKIYFCTKSFSKSDANFTDNQDFEVFFKTATATSTTGRLHKSGLWVTLTGVTNLLTYNRLLRAQTITTATTPDTGRRQLNTGYFTSPSVKYECIGSVTSAGITPQLVTHGVNETGIAGVSSITSSTLSFSGSSKQKQTTGTLSITDGDRYLTDFIGSGSLSIGSCMAIIQMN